MLEKAGGLRNPASTWLELRAEGGWKKKGIFFQYGACFFILIYPWYNPYYRKSTSNNKSNAPRGW